MPKYKLTDRDIRKIRELKERTPCVTNASIASCFDVSPSRISEILRDVHRDRRKNNDTE